MKFHSIKEPGQGQLPQEIPFFPEYSHKFDKFILLFQLFSIIIQIIWMAAFTLAGLPHIGDDRDGRFLLCKKGEETEKNWLLRIRSYRRCWIDFFRVVCVFFIWGESSWDFLLGLLITSIVIHLREQEIAPFIQGKCILLAKGSSSVLLLDWSTEASPNQINLWIWFSVCICLSERSARRNYGYTCCILLQFIVWQEPSFSASLNLISIRITSCFEI